MRIITKYNEMENCAIALGNFDGVHIAHQQIITNCVKYAKSKNIKSCVLLFDIHPKLFTGDKAIKILTPEEEKIELLSHLGVDCVYLMKFDETTMKMSENDFFSLLVKDLKATALFAGFDYTFGYKAIGNSEKLARMCKESNIHIEITTEIDIDNNKVSSTIIRDFILSGHIKEANKLLGRSYSVFGNIEKGKQNGTKMGIPTANISYQKNQLLPCDGVYKGIIKINEKEYKSLINIGKNPTFDADKRTLEVHIPNFCENIYDKEAKVFFEEKIRDEIKFNSPLELTEQIKKDLEVIKE